MSGHAHTEAPPDDTLRVPREPGTDSAWGTTYGLPDGLWLCAPAAPHPVLGIALVDAAAIGAMTVTRVALGPAFRWMLLGVALLWMVALVL